MNDNFIKMINDIYFLYELLNMNYFCIEFCTIMIIMII